MDKKALAAITDPDRVPDVDDGYGNWPGTSARAAATALAKLDLPKGLVALVYRCDCGVKTTVGRDYMVNVGALPEKCGECGRAYDQSKAEAVVEG